MLKHLSICAALVALGTGPVYDQEREAFLQTIEVPEAGFEVVLAAPKPGARALPGLGNMPEALVVRLPGGSLAVVFDDAKEMIKAVDLLRSSPASGSRVHIDGGTSPPVAFYIVPKVQGLPVGGEMMTLEEYENARRPVLVPDSIAAPAAISRRPVTAIGLP